MRAEVHRGELGDAESRARKAQEEIESVTEQVHGISITLPLWDISTWIKRE